MISGWYMASTSNISSRYNATHGYIHSVRIGRSAGGDMAKRRLIEAVPWCLDNGVFTGKFNEEDWIKKMDAMRSYSETCLFVVVPDVVGDCSATLAQFAHYRRIITDFPSAFVSQDGIKEQAHKIPWDDFDALFIGGSDHHKLGKEGGWILNEAKKRGKWVHVGRVNSVARIMKFWRADSWDGTHLGFMPSDVTKFHAAVLQVRSMKEQRQLFDLHTEET